MQVKGGVMKIWIVYLCAIGAISLVAFFLYASDKAKAKRGKWRIPEKVLLGFSFFGGAVGGTLAMFLFRHKTRHWYFWAVNFLGLAWQIAAGILIYLYL